MLLFSVSCDLYGEAKKKLEEELERYTGEKCIVLTMCTGVFRIPGPTESGSGEEEHVSLIAEKLADGISAQLLSSREKRERVEIPEEAIVCAARHYIAAHESAVRKTPVAFGRVCEGCKMLTRCKGDWMGTAAPLFEAAKVFPLLIREGERT